MPYLLSHCAGATSYPGPALTAPPLVLACAASVSCVMGHGEWLCCCCICCICCWCSPQAKKIPLCAVSTSTYPAAAAAAAAALFSLLLPLMQLPLLPTSCSCSGCCPSCAHRMFLWKGRMCSETQTLVPPALLLSFQAKGIALKIVRSCFPALLAA